MVFIVLHFLPEIFTYVAFLDKKLLYESLALFFYKLQVPDANCPRCDAIEGTAEHVLLHCPALQTHRDSDHIHALEHL